MFIRDLEYYQLEVSDNQFDRVNGGILDYGKGYGEEKPTKPTKPVKQFPSIAVTNISASALTQGGLLAVTETALTAITTSGENVALSAFELSLSAVAVS